MSGIDNHEPIVPRPASTRRTTIIIVAIILLGLGTAAYLLHPWSPASSHVHAVETLKYTCPMHPQIILDAPGECPICHMELVPLRSAGVAADTGARAQPHADPLRITPEGRIVAEVRTARAAYRYMATGIDAAAAVDYNEATHRVVAARYGGRIERLYVRETGGLVARGAPLMEIYSPELVTAQQDYLIARDARNLHTGVGMGMSDAEAEERMSERSRRLVESSRKRLELLGMSSAQIAALDARGDVAYTTTVFSPTSGVVLKRGATEGAYVAEGALLLELADLSSVWVIANVGEADVNRLKPGMAMRVSGPALDGEALEGSVEYIYPMIDPQTRTARVRGLFANPRLLLKPGMYVSASISIPSRDALAVPAGAVIRTGRRDLVYVEVAANTFEPREVKLGMKDGDYYEIAGGDLKVGDNVVAEGGFLIDSESRLSAPADHQAAAGTGGAEVKR